MYDLLHMNIKIPDGSEKYVLFQRTEYLYMTRSANLFIKSLYRILSRLISFNWYVRLEAILFPARIALLYSQDMEKEYTTLKDFLPNSVENILDIGCGVGGIDVFLYRHYNANINIYLLDKSAVDKKVFYFFEQTGSFYNSLHLAQELLILNGVDKTKIHTQEVTDKNKILFQENFGLIISLISWGFHYPVSTYLDEVYNKLKTGGILIIDVRKDTGGGELLKKKFGSISIVLDEEKYQRVLAIKK